jgi:hypothetical protein
MSSFPLELHDVLEEEYVSMYGPLPRSSREYDEKDILDHDWARVILQECGRAANGKTVAQELSALVVGDESLQFLIDSPAMTDRGKVLLQDYDDYAALAAKQGGKTAVEELRRGIVDEAFTGAVKPLRDVRLDKVYAALHRRAKEGKPRTALCISGGGIRSATFALGMIQGLASANILDRFDYLSTVSGGGYIGSWLSSWVRRHARGVTGVKEDLQRADTAIAESRPAVAGTGVPIGVKRDLPGRKVNPEPAPLRHLREYSNYLSPRLVPMPPPADAQNAPTTDIRRGPLHVVNTALNLTGGENLAWQQRMAESFTVSPFHTASLFLGFRPSREYGGSDGISLGTAVTISGAAASRNMGYHSSPTMAFLLTLFNIGLGSWLGNPGPHGQTSFDKSHPTTTLIPLFAELTGNTNSKSKWVYLSDGGHFENLALYEMVVRRCHRIVLSDGGADPNCTFEDLGNAIRKIRTDLGIPIDIRKITMAPRAKDGKPVTGEYVAFSTIRYSAVDEAAEDGDLIYIKPGVYSDEYFPYDVYNYAMESLAFPHEPTSDQFFSESQFESYRARAARRERDLQELPADRYGRGTDPDRQDVQLGGRIREESGRGREAAATTADGGGERLTHDPHPALRATFSLCGREISIEGLLARGEGISLTQPTP